MTSFNDREKAFESKFAHDAELTFKVGARRNKLLGLWAAEKLGKDGEAAMDYAKDVVMADLEATGDNDVVGKLLKDFGRAGLSIHISEIEQQMQKLLPQAQKEVMGTA